MSKNGKRRESFRPTPEQEKALERELIESYKEKGGLNDIQSRYIYEIAKAITGSKNNVFASLQPHVKRMDNVIWEKCLCFCFAYLRRYKMDKTIQTMKLECSELPKSTGFGKVSELDIFWLKLMKTSNALASKSFDEWVIEYRDAIHRNTYRRAQELTRSRSNKKPESRAKSRGPQPS